MCSNDEIILYADDTVQMFVRKTLEELTDSVNSRLLAVTVTNFHLIL